MTRAQRAAQIWPLLVLCGNQRQSLTYDQLSRAIGVPRPGLGQLLEPIQSYCILRGLPPLTSIVVSGVSGEPGEGFIAAADVPRAQQQVFRHDWLAEGAPTVEDLAAAVENLPTNGRSLEELRIAASNDAI